MNYQYKNFTIVLSYGDWLVYGTDKNTLKYGFIGRFDTDREAENYIDREF